MKKKYKIYANALLSDNKILFWYVGPNQMDIYDWYKDFYYSGINQLDYFSKHEITCVSNSFDTTEETNNDVFEYKAPAWFAHWEISEDSKGEPPYKRAEEYPIEWRRCL